MWFILIEDEIAGEFASPVAAELYASDLRRQGFDDIVIVQDEGSV